MEDINGHIAALLKQQTYQQRMDFASSLAEWVGSLMDATTDQFAGCLESWADAELQGNPHAPEPPFPSQEKSNG